MLQKKGIEIPVESVVANPNQPRKVFNVDELNDLAKSIKEFGVIQPIIVNKNKDGTYCLIAGERRLRASKLAGLKKIPAVIREYSGTESALIAVIENVQRENLSFLEEARAYKNLIDEYGLTQNELSVRIGKQQSTISNKLRLLTLPEEMQEKIIENKLTERHARALLRIEDKKIRNKILDKIISNNLNVKQSEKLINDYIEKNKKSAAKKNRVGYISYKIYMNTIRGAYKQIREMEKNVKIIEDDKGDYIEVKIVIPKNEGCFT